ncbi:MAG: alpha/beta fold hydrolase [bacterium]|nr:alpha/beta fold hydrolase [bacterium]
MNRTEIEPLYFGMTEKPLFGCYHAPRVVPGRDCGILLCAPMGSESIRFHRAYRNLADRLANTGFPVLRFDFYGCGDSSGDFEQGRLEQWLHDIGYALDEIRRKAPVANICLFGLRLGGSLAMMAGAERGDIDAMVLWDPAIGGKVYLEELRALHTRMLGYAHVLPKHSSADGCQEEILGFPLTEAIIADLEGLDLLSIRQKPARHILLVESHEKLSQAGLYRHLQALNAKITFRSFPAPQLWEWEESFDKVRVPHGILQSVMAWISEVYV